MCLGSAIPAQERILPLYPDTPVISPNAVIDAPPWGDALWEDAIRVARERRGSFFVLVLECAPEENGAPFAIT